MGLFFVIISFVHSTKGEALHSFAVEKTSALFDDADITDSELARAMYIRTLLLAELPKAFCAYVRSLRFVFSVDHNADATLYVHVDLVFQDPGAAITVTNAIVVLADGIYDRMVASTTVSLIAGVLTVSAREEGEHAQQYRDAARMLNR